MISIKTILTIAKKELKGYLDNPASYVAMIVFVLLWEFLFFRNAFLVGEASLRILYDYLPWTLLFFSAAVTMSAFASEKNEGTLELLLTHPVKEQEVVLAKFLSSLIFVITSLAFALPIALTISLFGPLDWGAVAGQILGSCLLSASLIALGLFVSSLFTNQIASLLTTVAASFFFVIAGSEFITAGLPLAISPLFNQLSLLTHVESISRGVIDLRDLWYFLSFVAIFLSFSFLELLKRKYGNRKDYYRSFQIGISLFTGIALLTNIIGNRIPGRIDLTNGKIYSLSPATRKVLKNLNDIVTITFYVSSKLPSQLTPVVREIKDVLRDYNQVSRGNIAIVYKDPSGNSQVAQEAVSRGIREMQFNVIGQEEFQVKTGFVGLVVSYGNNHEAIPFLNNSADLEYQLTGFIAKLTNKEKKTVGFLSGYGEKDLYSDYQALNQELSKQFLLKTVSLDEPQSLIASEAATLIIAGPTASIDEKARLAIKSFLKEGKNIFFLLDTYNINPQTLAAEVNSNSFSDFLKEYGVSVNQDLVYDLRSNETVRLGQGIFGLLMPYPFWLRAQSNDSSLITNRLNGILFPWTSSLTLDEEKIKNEGYEVTKLLSTTRYAGSQTGTPTLLPDKTSFSQENLKDFLLAVALAGQPESGKPLTGRIIVVGDSDFLTDQFSQNSPQNLAFGISAISWLSSQESLADIRIKQSGPKKLVFRSANDPSLIKLGNMSVVVIIPVFVGLTRIARRKKLRKEIYSFASVQPK